MQGIIDVISLANIMMIIYIINFFCAAALIFVHRKDPDATLAWILVLFFIPVLGLILYLVFSQNIARKKLFKLSPSDKKAVTLALTTQIKDIKEGKFVFNKEEAVRWKSLIKMNQRYDNAYYTQNNSVEIFTDGREKFLSLIEDIRKAEKSINIQYFIIKWDSAGKRLIRELTKKAEEGVEVRLLLDGMGCGQITKKRLKGFEKAGGKYAYFYKPVLSKILVRLNYRNHRKLAIIDEKTAYIGGFNIADEYLDKNNRFGHWRDTHSRIKGSAVIDITVRFILDWECASNEKINLADYYHNFEDDNYGYSGIQIISSGPDSYREQIKRAYLKMITSAEKSIYLQTPYFVPDASIHEAIKMAAYSGLDVNVMIPCMPDHPFVYWATYSYVGSLLKSGARVFIYDGGFLHSKTLVVDGEVSSIGSANFDRRSFSLNFETNAIIYDSDVAEKMLYEYSTDIEHSHELTLDIYNSRSVIIKFRESIARLLTNIL